MKSGKAKVKINIFYETRLPQIVKDEKLFKNILEAGLGKFAFANVEVNLVFVGSKKIKELNKKFLGKKGPTDVIAFNYEIPPYYPLDKNGINIKERLGKFLPFGDIFICTHQAKKQAKILRHSLKKELAILTVHGALHLAGFDHKTPAEKTNIQKLTDKIIDTTDL